MLNICARVETSHFPAQTKPHYFIYIASKPTHVILTCLEAMIDFVVALRLETTWSLMKFNAFDWNCINLAKYSWDSL